ATASATPATRTTTTTASRIRRIPARSIRIPPAAIRTRTASRTTRTTARPRRTRTRPTRTATARATPATAALPCSSRAAAAAAGRPAPAPAPAGAGFSPSSARRSCCGGGAGEAGSVDREDRGGPEPPRSDRLHQAGRQEGGGRQLDDRHPAGRSAIGPAGGLFGADLAALGRAHELRRAAGRPLEHRARLVERDAGGDRQEL